MSNIGCTVCCKAHLHRSTKRWSTAPSLGTHKIGGDPEPLTFYFERAEVFENAGEIDSMARDLEAAIALDDTDIRYRRAACILGLREPLSELPLGSCRYLVVMEDAGAPDHALFGRVLLLRAEPEAAAESFRRALDLSPGNIVYSELLEAAERALAQAR